MATAGSNILVLPFKRTHVITLSAALKQYISTKYDQHPDMFAPDLDAIDELRKGAVTHLEPHASGIRKIQAYAAQLVWMGGKFPIDVGIDFTWYPALGYETETATSQNNLRFELANILYNLAALYSQLAYHANKATDDGLKLATNYFCLAAGVISHIKTNVIPDMRSAAPDDMDPMTLECLEQLHLAQGQECGWQKAIKGGLKDASIAKLAAKVSDRYSQAYESATRSNVISSEWIHHVSAKQHHFAAAAQFRAACDCLEKRKYGEEVARLQDSLVCANSALKESRYINNVVIADLNGLKIKVQEDLKRAEKDNDMIYLNPVPPKSELKTLDRASMVSARVPKEVSDPLSSLGDQGELGRPLFSKLVPYSVHVAASIYAGRRDQTINSIIEELEALTSRIHNLFQSLNLPGSLQALEKPLGLAPGVLSHAEEIRQQNGPDRVRRSLDDVNKLKSSNQTTYQRGVGILNQEASEDEQARYKFGTQRWTREPSAIAGKKLYDQVKQLEGYFKSAEDSDKLVRQSASDNMVLIQKLSGSNASLEDYVPSSRRAIVTPAVDREVKKLRAGLDEVIRLESRRRRKIESLRNKAQADDVNPELLKEAARLEREYPMQKVEAAQFEDFFDKRLQRYESDQSMVNDERQEQSKLLSRVAEANTSFNTARRGDTSTKDRERALQNLENAYFAYKEILQNLSVGRKFYNDLAAITTRFEADCRSFAYERRAESAQLESDITTALPMSNLSLATATAAAAAANQQQPVYQGPPPPARQGAPPLLAAPVPVKPQPSAPVANLASSSASAAAAAPQTTPSTTWNEGMGIKFAGVTTPLGQAPAANPGGGGAAAPGGGAGGGQGRGSAGTTWNPGKGVQFG